MWCSRSSSCPPRWTNSLFFFHLHRVKGPAQLQNLLQTVVDAPDSHFLFSFFCFTCVQFQKKKSPFWDWYYRGKCKIFNVSIYTPDPSNVVILTWQKYVTEARIYQYASVHWGNKAHWSCNNHKSPWAPFFLHWALWNQTDFIFADINTNTDTDVSLFGQYGPIISANWCVGQASTLNYIQEAVWGDDWPKCVPSLGPPSFSILHQISNATLSIPGRITDQIDFSSL